MAKTATKSKSDKKDKTLVIVESPAKARTISRYLGSGFEVESSIGHIRDLPSNAAEIPAEVKEEAWSRLGVNVEEEFQPIYVIPRGKGGQVKKLRGLLRGADRLLLATDEDREGEAIAWHLMEVLKPKCPVRRMVFDEITETAIRGALDKTREIDLQLVSAQETRRILDRLFGYEVSPVLWRKVKPKLSAGRVQSVATRLIVEREWSRMQFVSAQYWDQEAKLKAEVESGTGEFDAKMIELAGQRLATGRDFDESTGKLKDNGKVRLLDGEAANRIARALKEAPFRVADVQEKPFTNRPYAPFITSTLQQEAGRKLRFTAQRTMRAAQSLYENGYITYMRTDSTTLSKQALNAARAQVRELYGDEYLPDAPRTYTKKSKNAQEAHEAIRPAGETFRTPQELAGELGDDQAKVYDLIWKRTMASQMKDAHGLRTTVRVEADAGTDGMATFTASGKVIQFPGFLRAYVQGSDDPAAELENQERILPAMSVDQILALLDLAALDHTTQPPARYTEASLIREMEERGIGRPSTYASIIQTIQDRGYVWSKGSALIPTFTAFAVVNLLKQHLPDVVDYDFTAKMEDELDAIANGQRDATPWLKAFYFGDAAQHSDNGDHLAELGLKSLVENSGDEIDARAVCSIPIGQTEQGEPVVVRVGRYGPYIQIGERDERATLPDDLPPDEVTLQKAEELIEQASQGDQELGQDPETGKPVYLKSGRFGPYVQLGDPELTEKGKVKRGGKPKMASLFPSMSMETITLEQALELLSFPKELGKFPDNDEPIFVQDGRFGPYVKSGTETRSLPDHEKLRTITLAEAIELLKQPKAGGRRAAAAAIAELGKHPQNELEVSVKSGRYGPYVTDGFVNATIPKGNDPATVTMEKAVDLLSARAEKMRDQGKDPYAKKDGKKAGKKKKAKKKAGKKKAAKKKSSKKKTTAATKTSDDAEE